MSTELVQLNPRAAWLEERRKGIGGSDVISIYNQERGCERRLWYDKRNYPTDYLVDEETQALFDRGHELEDVAAEYYERKSGRKVRRMPTRVSRDYPFMRVNVDRQIVNDVRGPGVLEIKTANQFVFRKVKEEFPKAYLLQLQHALAITGYAWGSFAILHPDSWQLIWFDFDRDEEIIRDLREREAEFWRKVELGPMPEALREGDKRCGSCLFRRTCRGSSLVNALPEDARGECEADDSLSELANDFKQARFLREEYERLEENIKDRLKEAIGERGAVEIPNAGMRVIYKPQAGAMRVDSAFLKSKFPEVYEKVLKQSAASRPFKVYEF